MEIPSGGSWGRAEQDFSARRGLQQCGEVFRLGFHGLLCLQGGADAVPAEQDGAAAGGAEAEGAE